MDERIKAIRTKFLTLIVILAIGWQASNNYRTRRSLFREHQLMTAVYVLTTGTNRDAYQELDLDMELANLPKDKRIADFVFDSNRKHFEYSVALPGPGIMHVEMTRISTPQLGCAFSFDVPVKFKGEITIARLQTDESLLDWLASTSYGVVPPEDRNVVLSETAFKLGVNEENPRESIRNVRIKWRMHRDTVPVLGVSVSATHAVLLAFALAMAVTMLVCSNARHVASLTTRYRKEPWLVLDAGPRFRRAEAGVPQVLRLVQDTIERCGIAVYYAVVGLGAAAAGVLGIVTLLESQMSNLWVLPVCVGIAVSLVSGFLAVTSMIRTRRDWQSADSDEPPEHAEFCA